MLRINPVQNNVVNFKKNSDPYAEKGVVYRTYKTEATTGKKWGVGIASWILPGSGQAINNEWGKAVGFFALAGIAPSIIGVIAGVGMSLGLNSIGNSSRKISVVGLTGMTGAMLAAVGGRIWACVDAVKNAKSEIDVPVKQ